MEAAELSRLTLGAVIGGVFSFAFSQVSFGSRLTRIETQMEEVLRVVRGGSAK